MGESEDVGAVAGVILGVVSGETSFVTADDGRGGSAGAFSLLSAMVAVRVPVNYGGEGGKNRLESRWFSNENEMKKTR